MTIIELHEENANSYDEWLPADMAENFERRYYRGMVAESEDGTPLAGMVYELLHLEEEAPTEAAIRWLKVDDPEAAGPLFEAYRSAAAAEEVKRSSFVIPVKNCEKEKAALKAEGFSVKLTEGDDIIISLKELLALPIMKTRYVPETIFPLSAMTGRNFRRVATRCVMLHRKGVCEDLSSLRIDWFEPDVSCFSEEGGTVNGLFLFHQLPSGMLAIQLMIALSSTPQPILLGMMRQFIMSTEEKYGQDVRIVLNRHNQSSLALSEKLLPRGFGVPVYAGSREE